MSALVFNRATDNYLFTIAEARGAIGKKLTLRSADSTSVLDLSNNGIINFNATEVKINGNTVVTSSGSSGSTLGSLEVTGSTKLQDLSAGATDISSTLNVDGAVTFDSTLNVDGAVTFDNTLNVDGAVTFDNTLNVTGDTSVTTFDSTGATSLATGGGVVNIASSGLMTTVKGTLNVDEAVTLTGNVQIGSGENANLQIGSGVKGGQIYSTATDHELVIDPFTIDGSGSTTTDASGSVTILGNLVVRGNTTTFHSSTLDISDHNLTLAKGTTTAGMADGAGITIGDDSYATFNYVSSGSKWATNIPLDVSGALTATGAITGTTFHGDGSNLTGLVTELNDLNDCKVLSSSYFIGGGGSSESGGSNTCFGYNSGNSLTSGANNTLIGTTAGQSLTNKGNNTIIGREACRNGASSNSTYIGVSAGFNSSATHNIGIGEGTALENNGQYNIAIGPPANGYVNTFTFHSANSSCTGNIAIGEASMQRNQTTPARHGQTTWTGTNNICIGKWSSLNNASTSNAIAIGYQVLADSNEVRIGNDSITDTYLKGDLHINNKDISGIKKITATGGLDISGHLLATTPETQIPVTKSTFTLVKNNLGDLSGTNAQGGGTFVESSGDGDFQDATNYIASRTVLSGNSCIKMEFKVNFISSPEAEQTISFKVKRSINGGTTASDVFTDSNIGSNMGVSIKNVYNGTFIDDLSESSVNNGDTVSYQLQYKRNCPSDDTISSNFGIVSGGNYIFLQELYVP